MIAYYLKHLPELRTQARNLAKQQSDDLLQNLFLRVTKVTKTPDKPLHWLRVAMRNEWLNMNRSGAGRRGAHQYGTRYLTNQPEHTFDKIADRPDVAEHSYDLHVLLARVAKLPHDFADALTEEVAGTTCADLARARGVTPTTIRTRTIRAREMLKAGSNKISVRAAYNLRAAG